MELEKRFYSNRRSTGRESVTGYCHVSGGYQSFPKPEVSVDLDLQYAGDKADDIRRLTIKLTADEARELGKRLIGAADGADECARKQGLSRD